MKKFILSLIIIASFSTLTGCKKIKNNLEGTQWVYEKNETDYNLKLHLSFNSEDKGKAKYEIELNDGTTDSEINGFSYDYKNYEGTITFDDGDGEELDFEVTDGGEKLKLHSDGQTYTFDRE